MGSEEGWLGSEKGCLGHLFSGPNTPPFLNRRFRSVSSPLDLVSRLFGTESPPLAGRE
jgi:hypothetical protein